MVDWADLIGLGVWLRFGLVTIRIVLSACQTIVPNNRQPPLHWYRRCRLVGQEKETTCRVNDILRSTILPR